MQGKFIEKLRRSECNFVIQRERIQGQGGEFFVHDLALLIRAAPIGA